MSGALCVTMSSNFYLSCLHEIGSSNSSNRKAVSLGSARVYARTLTALHKRLCSFGSTEDDCSWIMRNSSAILAHVRKMNCTKRRNILGACIRISHAHFADEYTLANREYEKQRPKCRRGNLTWASVLTALQLRRCAVQKVIDRCQTSTYSIPRLGEIDRRKFDQFFALALLAYAPADCSLLKMQNLLTSDIDVSKLAVAGIEVGTNVHRMHFSVQRWPRERLFFNEYASGREFDSLIKSCFKKRGITGAKVLSAAGRP